MSAENGKKRMWMREASLHRLNMVFRNKAEATLDFLENEIPVEELELSGLSTVEVTYLEKWVNGTLSGRHCMVAMLENRVKDAPPSATSEEKTKSVLSSGAHSRPPEFSMLSSSLSLPDGFLCDSGYLFERIFSRAPGTVVREALKLLTSKAMEKDAFSLRVDQINLALKQLRIDNLSVRPNVEESMDGSDENSHQNVEKGRCAKDKKTGDTDLVSPEASSLRLAIMIEIIRFHIKSTRKGKLTSSPSGSVSPARSGHRSHPSHPHKHGLSTSKTNSLPDKPEALDTASLEAHLYTPMQQVAEHAEQLQPEDLEATNTLLKPYIRQLSSLKASLTVQLRDLEESRAYFSLGVTKDATEGAIKKAYHSKAIKLHPDKPGGDTAKFQQLQTSYQEILAKRKSAGLDSHAETHAAMDSTSQAESKEVRTILEEMGQCLDAVKASADRCSQIGQLNIQCQKHVDKIISQGFPTALPDLSIFLSADEDDAAAKKSKKKANKKNKNKRSKDAVVSVSECSPLLVMAELEDICDQMQRLAALAMKLPTCGFRYGLATAVHTS